MTTKTTASTPSSFSKTTNPPAFFIMESADTPTPARESAFTAPVDGIPMPTEETPAIKLTPRRQNRIAA